jgi:hypothetical protein
MQSQSSHGARRATSPDFAATLRDAAEDELMESVFEGWDGDYGDGRSLLLRRVAEIRPRLLPGERSHIGRRLFALLITVGEESGDMRFAHLGVESRDLLEYGY